MDDHASPDYVSLDEFRGSDGVDDWRIRSGGVTVRLVTYAEDEADIATIHGRG